MLGNITTMFLSHGCVVLAVIELQQKEKKNKPTITKQRRKELGEAIGNALIEHHATYGEVIDLLGKGWMWKITFGRYEE